MNFPGNRKIRLWHFWLAISLLYCVTVTLMEFHGVPVSDFYSFRTTGMQYLLIAGVTSGLLLLLSSSRILFAATFPLLALISGTMCYFNLSIGTRLTPVAIELAMINDASMWWSMISPMLAAAALLSLAAGIFLAVVRWRFVEAGRRDSLIAAAIGFVIGVLPPAFVMRLEAPVGGRLPYSIYFSTRDYFRNRAGITSERDNFDNMPANSAPDSPDVILVIGETLRADHLPQNGYGRNTMPILSRMPNVVTLPDVYSEYTYTDRSVPHILTAADSISPDRAFEEQSLVTLFKNAGYRTSWIANQDLSRSYTYFAHEADTLIYCNADRSFYSYDKWLDRDMLRPFSAWFKSGRDEGKRALSVLHMIGSHWWYNSHYEEKHAHFKPEATHKDVGGLTAEQMINSYDNTIVATDEFLAELYDSVKDRNAVIFFISDHGEALGEDGIFLHAGETDALHRPACLIIYTPEYERLHPDVVKRLRKNAAGRETTDMVFHSVLDLAGISTPALDSSKSIVRRSEPIEKR